MNQFQKKKENINRDKKIFDSIFVTQEVSMVFKPSICAYD